MMSQKMTDWKEPDGSVGLWGISTGKTPQKLWYEIWGVYLAEMSPQKQQRPFEVFLCDIIVGP